MMITDVVTLFWQLTLAVSQEPHQLQAGTPQLHRPVLLPMCHLNSINNQQSIAKVRFGSTLCRTIRMDWDWQLGILRNGADRLDFINWKLTVHEAKSL